MKISYSAKGILWQGFAVGFAASSVAVLGVPPWLPVLIFGAGLAFGLGADLPSGLGRRFWPALLLPLGICALWGVALHLSGGDYSLEQADAWLPVRVLAYPGYFLGSFLLESSQWVWDFFPTALGVEISTWHYTGWDIAFGDSAGMYAILHLYGWYVAGFAGPALARGPLGTGTRLDRPAVVLMLCAAGCGGFLYWELAERTRLLLPEWNTIPEEVTVVREETPYRDYFPFSTLEPQEKIARLDAPASLRIRDGYPRLDGATAFMPLSSATLMAVYEIPSSLLTLDGATDPDAERYMFISQFFSSNTSRKAYSNLINGKADLIVVFGPSEEQQAEADTAGVPLKLTPIGKEAFVFFVNENNSVDGLSLEDVRKIYSGGIGNWREVGGPDAPILAYQRPKDSGSRTAMDQMVMQGLSQARPLREEYFAPMEGIVTAVADYRNESPAIGYSFRWFLTTMYSEPGLKLLTINGVAPTVEHIADGTYPLTRTFYAVTRKKDALPETEALAAWLAGPEGQALVGKAGYVPIR